MEMQDLTTPRRFLGLASNSLMPAAQIRNEEDQFSKGFKLFQARVEVRQSQGPDRSWFRRFADASPADELKETLALAEQRRLRKVERSSASAVLNL